MSDVVALSSTVEEVVRRLGRGEHVSVEAVPGAGKTFLLLSASTNHPTATLVLAYNTQLAAAPVQALASRGLEDVVCCTFHSLCARCLAPARDDAQLEAAIERAESGELLPRHVPNVRQVLIDEAQDVRPLFVRLLRVLGLVRDDIVLLCTGDRQQLIYDFDPEYPSTLETLLHPDRAFATARTAWAKLAFQRSYRLTPPVVAVVNAVFGTPIESISPLATTAPSIEVRAPKSAFQLATTLRDVLHANDDTLLLVDRRRGNRPLYALLNTLSREGKPMHVHGVDGEQTEGGKLRCCTWWGAKGLECDTAVVLLPSNAPRNPTYVALTRARRKLIIVLLDSRKPHAAVCHGLMSVARARPEYVEFHDATARRAVELGETLPFDASLERADFATRDFRNLDTWTPRRAKMEACATTRGGPRRRGGPRPCSRKARRSHW